MKRKLEISQLRNLAVVMVAAMFSLFVGCQTTSETGEEVVDASLDSGPILLSEGDVVRVTFPSSPELSFVQTIQADGMLNLPTVGEVVASGKSPEALQSELKEKFKDELVDSTVLVTVESRSAVVYVSGMVRSPGKVMLNRRMTVFEVIMECGGFASGANQRKVTIIRNVGGKHQTTTVDLSKVMKGEATEASYVRPYDTVIVGESIL